MTINKEEASSDNGMPDVDNALIHEVVFELQQFLHQEIDIIESEVNRTKSLVTEAVKGISESFKYLQSLSEKQQSMVNELIKASITFDEAEELASPKKLLALNVAIDSAELNRGSRNEINNAKEIIEKLRNITPKINDAVALGVRSLQFEDLTRQSLGSLQKNVQSIHEISDVLVSFEQHKQIPVHQQLLALKEKCETVYQQTKQTEDSRSVNQITMDEGDVELF